MSILLLVTFELGLTEGTFVLRNAALALNFG